MKKLLYSMLAVLILTVVSVSAATDLNVKQITVSPLSGNPGSEITISAELENTGTTQIDTVELSSSSLKRVGSSEIFSVPAIQDVTNLANGSTAIATWKVTLPKILSGDYEATLTVVDAANSSNTDTEDYIVTVNSYTEMSTNVNNFDITLQKEKQKTVSFTVTNDGSENLDITIEAADISDNDNDKTTLSPSATSLTALAPGASQTIDVVFDVDRKMDTGDHTGNITLRSGTLEKVITINLEVEPEICEDGIVGDLEISIDEPDEDDEFAPGEKINVEVDVENNADDDMDVVVTAIIYDFTDDDEIESIELDDMEIEEDEEESFEFEIEIPSSGKIDDNNKFYLYVKACKKGDEDEHCIYDRVEIDIEREENHVVISEFEISPEEGLTCGSSFNAYIEVENMGTKDQDDVYIQLKNSELGISERSRVFDLEEYDDSDNDYAEQFLVQLPSDVLPGTYWLEVIVYFDDGDERNSELLQINVESCSTSQNNGSAGSNGVSLSVSNDMITLSKDQQKWAIPVVIENNGFGKAKLTLDATELSAWAEVLGVEAPQLLFAGEKYHAYVYLKAKEGVEPGQHNLRVNLRNEAGLIQSKIISVNVLPSEESSEPVISDDTGADEDSKAKQFFSDKSKIFWVIGDLVLVVIAIFFIRMLFKK